jgi:hypothetical protein
MNEIVMVAIPVSPEAATALRDDPAKLPIVGRLVSTALAPARSDVDPLVTWLTTRAAERDAPELDAAEVKAEIDAVRGSLRP